MRKSTKLEKNEIVDLAWKKEKTSWDGTSDIAVCEEMHIAR